MKTALIAHQLLIANKLDLFIMSSYMNLTFSCATYRSLYLLSSESHLTLLYVLFQLTHKTSPSSQLLPKSYLFECLHPPIFANAFLISKVVSVVYQEGLNVIAVIDLFSTNKRLDQPINSLLLQINPTLMSALLYQTKHHALCLTSFTFYRLSIILDLANTNLLSTLGSIGVKVVVIYQ